MFLKNHIYFLKKPFKSPASRKINYFFNLFNINNKIKISNHLKIKKKNNSGRNQSGKIVFRTRTSFLLKKKKIKINYNFRYLRIGVILSFNLISFKNKTLSLIFFNNGSLTYFLTSSYHYLFFMFFPQKKILKKFKKFKLFSISLLLFQFKKLSYISCLELLPGKNSQYILSPGTKGRIISFDKKTHTVLIELPSKVKKLFSYYSLALKGSVALNLHKKTSNGKFGYWRVNGIKPLSRGVAMNPVDHPNGGRTKSLKYPKTPWGKTTKFK